MFENFIILLIIIASFLIVWLVAYRPLLKLQREISIEIIKEITPDIQSSNNLMITLSSSSIVLSFAALNFLKGKTLIHLSYIKISWALFAFSILFGILAGITIYSFKAHTSIAIKKLVDNEEGKEIDKESLGKIAGTKRRLQRMLFGFLFGQTITFIAAFASLIVFATKNL